MFKYQLNSKTAHKASELFAMSNTLILESISLDSPTRAFFCGFFSCLCIGLKRESNSDWEIESDAPGQGHFSVADSIVSKFPLARSNLSLFNFNRIF